MVTVARNPVHLQFDASTLDYRDYGLRCAGFNPVDITGIGEGGASVNGVLAVREDSEAFVMLDLIKEKKGSRKGGGVVFLSFLATAGLCVLGWDR